MNKLHLTMQRFNGDVAKDRNTYIGGSDAGTIMGVNPWKSPYMLWLEKTKQVEPVEISGKLAVWFGTEEEEIVAKRFTFETGKKVKRSNFEYSCKEYPFLIGHVDRLVIGEDAGLECKTTSAWNKTNYENGDIPPQYYWQCIHYLMLTGKSKWYIAVKKDNTQFHILQVERNNEHIDALLNAERTFWGCVVNIIHPPSIDGSVSTADGLNKRYQNTIDDTFDLSYSRSITKALQEREEISNQIKVLEEMRTEKDNVIKSELGEHTQGFTAGFMLSWKNQTRENFNLKKFKKDFPNAYKNLAEEYPEALKACATESSSRTLRITKRKEEN